MSNTLYSFNDKEFVHINAKLNCVTKSTYGTDWHSTMHTHPFTEFFYITSGKGQFLIGNEMFTVAANDLIVINPNIIHTEKSLGDYRLEYIVLGISNVSFAFNGKLSGTEYSVFHYQADSLRILFYLNEIVREAEGSRYLSDTICQNLLEILIIDMLRRNDSSIKLEPSISANHACIVAKRYIENNFKEPITLDDLANVTHMNKFYLSHIFADNYKISPINYLILKRVEESKNLLITTNHSISGICSIVGFSSPSYFSQAFKKATGMKPVKYRAVNSNKSD